YMRDYYQGTNPNADSVIYLYREWGPYALNFKLQRQFQFYGSRNLTEERLPGVEWRSSLQDLGHGLYGGFVMSADAFRKQWFASTGAPFTKDSLDYQRVDIHPSLEWPAHPAPWLDITPRLELRGTYYTKSQGTGGPDDYTGGAILRRYGVLGLDISGPRLYRNYGGGTLRHIIEPFVDFQVVSADSRASKIPLLDQVDRVALDQRTVTYGIRNRLYGTDHRLILDSELSQTYSQNRDLSFFGPKSSPYSPVSLTLRTWPTEHLNADLRLRYNILSHQLDSKSLSASYSRGGNFARMTYLESKAAVVDPSLALDPAYDFTQTTGLGLPATYSMLPATKEIQFSAALSIWKKRISITPSIDRDLLTGDWRNQHLFLWYNGSCYSLGLEAGRRQIGAFRDSEYRFMVRLKNVGTALDLHGSTGAYAQ
ncbi:MAG: LPS assembly protein LptD, partial [Acidobacteriota bacterium]